ncbi:MAG: hypothetical protein P8X79_05375, partial [Reinekea sp.]
FNNTNHLNRTGWVEGYNWHDSGRGQLEQLDIAFGLVILQALEHRNHVPAIGIVSALGNQYPGVSQGCVIRFLCGVGLIQHNGGY